MRHASAEALDRLEPLLEKLRGVSGLVERKRGNFGRGSQAFLHFHEDPAGLFADVKAGAEWERLRVVTTKEQQALLRRVRALLAG